VELQKAAVKRFFTFCLHRALGGFICIVAAKTSLRGGFVFSPRAVFFQNMKNIILASLVTLPLFAGEPFPKEAEWLKDVKVAEGFEATLFSAPPQSNYPVFIAASADGALFVSSDGNGSLDRKPNRGRILRLRDTDGDGRADEVKEFVKDVDSPRGLVVDGNTVYCVHPPHLSAFIDKDGDGISDEQKVLVKNIAFAFKDRPADHTTNGMELGIDGWLYIAGGDFGFMEAEGTDGRKLQLRGGGIIRVRPDGTGLQLYSRGTRNILEAAVSPLMDIFSRDNTNDGGGWDIRFHHFSGFEDHGYPRLYKNFADEIIKPLADYGGGSGCGACWIDEPGWPAAWNNLPYTSDWGRGPIFRHTVKPKGATFEETEKPAELVKVTRSTDIDVDARGYAYVSSWKGPATFNWGGPEHGYIVRVAPKGHVAPKVPDFMKATDGELVKLLESPSYRTRLEAQRTLVARGLKQDSIASIQTIAKNAKAPAAARVAALYTLKQGLGAKANETIAALAGDSTMGAFALRALTDREDQEANVPAAPLVAALKSEDARTRKEAVISLARLHGLTGIWADNENSAPPKVDATNLAQHATAIAPLLGDNDAVVAHTAMQVMRQLSASDACFAILDNAQSATPQRNGALMALRGIHDKSTVAGLVERLNKTKDITQRQGLITALCRLYFIEGKWKGNSWGTRPDTRGPFYQPEEWAETQTIADALKKVSAEADAQETALLSKEFERHRIKLGDSIAKMISLAEKDAALLPNLVKQLAQTESIPANAVPLLVKATADANDEISTTAALALCKTDDRSSGAAILGTLARITAKKQDTNKLLKAFFASRLIENQHQAFEQAATALDGAGSVWADAALLNLAARKVGSPEPKAQAAKALDAGWAEPKRRAQIITAAALANDKSRAVQIVTALNDADKTVAEAAAAAVKTLKLDPAIVSAQPTGPLISTLKVDDVLAQVMTTKGDVARGEQLFTAQGCVACHTVKASEPPKGPFLGNIATTYKRRELAESILNPGKTIAQGFVTNVFTMKDGSVQMGFVTQEAEDKIVIRTIAAQEITLDPKLITKRDKSDKSLMPEGLAASLTVKDFASLLDYLEALAANK
jgi:putative membrane-bound dehydrogenase-like protein